MQGAKATAAGVVIDVEIDMNRMNKWLKKLMQLKAKDSAKAIRATGLKLMGNIMDDWAVDTGRSRMAFGGLHKKLGKPVSWTGGQKRSTKTSRGRAYLKTKVVENQIAKAEGLAAGSAKDYAEDKEAPYVEIINPVVYVPPVEKRYGDIRRNVRKMSAHFQKEIKKAIADSMEDSQK